VIIGGLVVSFALTELVGSTVLSALGLPQNFLFWLGIGLLLLLAVGLMIPVIGEWIERPFMRLGASRYADSVGGFVLGLSLGLVFVPCAGPVLAAISAAAAKHRFTPSSFLVTLFYAVGATLPLLILAIVAQRATTGWTKLRTKLPVIRRTAGAVLLVTTLAIAFGLLDPLQRAVPGYTSALENHIESSSSVSEQLRALDGEHANAFAKKAAAMSKMATLPKLGRAPNFTGIVKWLNTPDDKPLSLTRLTGKVVLVDFWTYSCINCQRSLPHVEGWYNDYKKDGLVVVGVSTPEFAFEHVVSNVQSAAGHLGVDYPIAIDNNDDTWYAYGNEYWPAEYLIDPTGEVRAYDFGEGGYGAMEGAIRALLTANGVTRCRRAPMWRTGPRSTRPHRRVMSATEKGNPTPLGLRSCTTSRWSTKHPILCRSIPLRSTGHGRITRRKRQRVRMHRSISISLPATCTSSWVEQAPSLSPSTDDLSPPSR
jgi:cytochrome c biogenesis protein CcdA/thiol-disulfide isomerase/thioredoxin